MIKTKTISFKSAARIAVALTLMQIGSPTLLKAQVAASSVLDDPAPSAVTLRASGKCDYSTDGVTFVKLEHAQVLEQGAIVRTGENGMADLFFRRMGTTVRLQAGTEIKLETMAISMKGGLPEVLTLLDLRKGRIFTVVRSAVAGATLEIRNAIGRSVVEGSGVGRYIITADGTHVTAKGSGIPLKVICEDGITIVTAGQQFARKDGKMLPLDSTVWVKDLIQLDELQSAGEDLVPDTRTAKP